MARPIEATPKVKTEVYQRILQSMQNPAPVVFPQVDMQKITKHIDIVLAQREKK